MNGQTASCAKCGISNWECHAMCSHDVGNCCETCRDTAGRTHAASAQVTNEQVQAELQRRGLDDCLYTSQASVIRDEMERAARAACPTCGKPVHTSFAWNEWACSDPNCESAHGPGPGGGRLLMPRRQPNE